MQDKNEKNLISIDIGSDNIGYAIWSSRLESYGVVTEDKLYDVLGEDATFQTMVIEKPHFRNEYPSGLYKLGVMTGFVTNVVDAQITTQIKRLHVAQALAMPYKYTKDDTRKAVSNYLPELPNDLSHHVTDAIGIGIAWLLRSGVPYLIRL